jgi:hypothetical protein
VPPESRCSLFLNVPRRDSGHPAGRKSQAAEYTPPRE